MNWELSRIVPDVEDAFGFAIPEEDTRTLNTVGDISDYVLARRFCDDRDACLGSIALHKVQRALMSVLQLSRDVVKPSAKLSAVIPRRRRRTWRTMERLTGFHLPWLRRPQKVVMTATLATIGLGASVPTFFGLKPFQGASVVAVVSIAAFGYLFYLLTECLVHDLPPDIATVGDLARATLARNYQPILAESRKSATDAEVWNILRHIVGEKLAILPHEVARDMDLSGHFIAT
jgi:hypothetical protein